nr:immunoglobulin heavy chain junction region [Mus musculus]MBK4198054.1 immunoglobulin heavy chain junction region [Mus musculus]
CARGNLGNFDYW